jgi:hypothetical protein
VPQTRCAWQATAGMDIGVVRKDLGCIKVAGSNTTEAMPFDSTCRHPTNTCEETRSALCRITGQA